MTERIRVAVVGAGTMGMNHVRVFSMLRDAELITVVDSDGQARARAESHGLRSAKEVDDVVGDVDAVTVAVPTAAHYSVARRCLELGLHVLVEKPITREVAEAEDLLRLANQRELVLQVGHVERFNPAVQELTRILRGQRVLAISARRCSPPTPRIADVSVIYDLLIHDIDIALSIARSPVRRVSAMGSAVRTSAHDVVMAHLEFESGVLAALMASKITQQRIRELDITTERAYVAVDYMSHGVSIFRDARLVLIDETPQEHYQKAALIEQPLVPAGEPLYLELEHFLRCIRGAVPQLTADEAVAALRVAGRIESDLAVKVSS